ncbi:hypothetical protein [Burkholderia sp. Leaf177]|uniref:hypothetical protein n=1 Tax=Burkholderia sp. Leaf177 TaxID=1736287 RepID=UPI000ACFB939|nr:hypothetical protein [Burkholderia sp. Leaf177]
MTIAEVFAFYACLFASGIGATMLLAQSMTQTLAEKAERNGCFSGLGEEYYSR